MGDPKSNDSLFLLNLVYFPEKYALFNCEKPLKERFSCYNGDYLTRHSNSLYNKGNLSLRDLSSIERTCEFQFQPIKHEWGWILKGSQEKSLLHRPTFLGTNQQGDVTQWTSKSKRKSGQDWIFKQRVLSRGFTQFHQVDGLSEMFQNWA